MRLFALIFHKARALCQYDAFFNFALPSASKFWLFPWKPFKFLLGLFILLDANPRIERLGSRKFLHDAGPFDREKELGEEGRACKVLQSMPISWLHFTGF